MVNGTSHSGDAGGKPLLGSLNFLDDPASLECMGAAGLDFVIVDMEHAARGVSQVQTLIRGAEAAGISVFVRVPTSDASTIQQVLEAGAMGIVVPTVSSSEEAEKISSACRYPPQGTRGTCRMSRSAGFGKNMSQWEEHVWNANRDVWVIGLVEDRAGVAELEKIMTTLDIVLIGRADLAADLGYPGEVDSDPVMQIVKEYEELAHKHGKRKATMCYSATDAANWVSRGYSMLLYSIDAGVLYRGYATWVEELTRLQNL